SAASVYRGPLVFALSLALASRYFLSRDLWAGAGAYRRRGCCVRVNRTGASNESIGGGRIPPSCLRQLTAIAAVCVCRRMRCAACALLGGDPISDSEAQRRSCRRTERSVYCSTPRRARTHPWDVC